MEQLRRLSVLSGAERSAYAISCHDHSALDKAHLRSTHSSTVNIEVLRK